MRTVLLPERNILRVDLLTRRPQAIDFNKLKSYFPQRILLCKRWICQAWYCWLHQIVTDTYRTASLPRYARQIFDILGCTVHNFPLHFVDYSKSPKESFRDAARVIMETVEITWYHKIRGSTTPFLLSDLVPALKIWLICRAPQERSNKRLRVPKSVLQIASKD